MLLILKATIIVSLVSINFFFFLIKRELSKRKFEFRLLWFHSENVSEFKRLILAENDEQRKNKYKKILFAFNLSLGILIFSIVVFIILTLMK